MGIWVGKACPRMRVLMDMAKKMGMEIVWVLLMDPMGMWVVMAGSRVRVGIDMGMELAMVKV